MPTYIAGTDGWYVHVRTYQLRNGPSNSYGVALIKMHRGSAIFLSSPFLSSSLVFYAQLSKGLLVHQQRTHMTVSHRQHRIGMSDVPRDMVGWSRGTEQNLPFINMVQIVWQSGHGTRETTSINIKIHARVVAVQGGDFQPPRSSHLASSTRRYVIMPET